MYRNLRPTGLENFEGKFWFRKRDEAVWTLSVRQVNNKADPSCNSCLIGARLDEDPQDYEKVVLSYDGRNPVEGQIKSDGTILFWKPFELVFSNLRALLFSISFTTKTQKKYPPTVYLDYTYNKCDTRFKKPFDDAYPVYIFNDGPPDDERIQKISKFFPQVQASNYNNILLQSSFAMSFMWE